MTLGHFRLEGIPPAPRGVPQVEVTFDIDANGILNVSAGTRDSSKEQRVTITASTHLDRSRVDRMVREAEQHAEEDRGRREEIEARNRADSLVYAAEEGDERLWRQGLGRGARARRALNALRRSRGRTRSASAP